MLSNWSLFKPYCSLFSRDGESRGPGAGRTRLPHALPPGVPRVPPWDDEALLEEGSGRKADLRIHPVVFGRLLHSHGATVPARRQPLVWGILWGGGGGGLLIWGNISGEQSGGITENFNMGGRGGALMRLQRKRFSGDKLVPKPHGYVCESRKTMSSEVEGCPLVVSPGEQYVGECPSGARMRNWEPRWSE